ALCKSGLVHRNKRHTLSNCLQRADNLRFQVSSGAIMKTPRRKFLHLAMGATALPPSRVFSRLGQTRTPPKSDFRAGSRDPSLVRSVSSDVDDRDDPVVAINDDDLIADDEIHVPAPLGMNPDERRGYLHHPHAGWHRGADADREVDVIDTRYIPAGQDFSRISVRCSVVNNHQIARPCYFRTWATHKLG